MKALGVSRGTIAGVAKRFVMEAALGRKMQENRARKVIGEEEAKSHIIACSAPPEGKDRWTMQMTADELIRLNVVEYITDSTVCDTMKKRTSAMACERTVHPGSQRGASASETGGGGPQCRKMPGYAQPCCRRHSAVELLISVSSSMIRIRGIKRPPSSFFGYTQANPESAYTG